jgi:hypothetical protein
MYQAALPVLRVIGLKDGLNVQIVSGVQNEPNVDNIL